MSRTSQHWGSPGQQKPTRLWSKYLKSTNKLFDRTCWPIYLNYTFMVQFSSVQSLSHVRLFVAPWITACQASLSLTTSATLKRPKRCSSLQARRQQERGQLVPHRPGEAGCLLTEAQRNEAEPSYFVSRSLHLLEQWISEWSPGAHRIVKARYRSHSFGWYVNFSS